MESPQTLTIWRAIMLLLLVANTLASKPSSDPFSFIKNLEGCHKGQSLSGIKQLKGYLEKFGYLKQTKNNTNYDEFDDVLEEAIKNYQHNYHLQSTGVLDSSTIAQMMKPRCGVPDIVKNTQPKNPKHFHTVAHYNFFYPGPRKWPDETTHLRYKFISSGPIENIRSICAKAFEKWAQVTHFTFEQVDGNSEAEIEIGFFRKFHGDGEPFDGKSGTFAHATAPTHGQCHFDGDETWSENPGPNEIDLESVAVHEIGHLLGLDHSEDRNAIMFAYFDYGITKRDLATDDIQGIQALYGLQ